MRGRTLRRTLELRKLRDMPTENYSLEIMYLLFLLINRVYRATSQAPFQADPLGSADGESVTQLLMLLMLGWMSNDSFRPGDISLSYFIQVIKTLSVHAVVWQGACCCSWP